jgi:hypothetical protein
VAEWDALFAGRLLSLSRPEPLRLHLVLAAGPEVDARVRDLVEREGGCCSFFTLPLTPGEDLINLDIMVDHAHEAVLNAARRGGRITATGPDRIADSPSVTGRYLREALAPSVRPGRPCRPAAARGAVGVRACAAPTSHTAPGSAGAAKAAGVRPVCPRQKRPKLAGSVNPGWTATAWASQPAPPSRRWLRAAAARR